MLSVGWHGPELAKRRVATHGKHAIPKAHVARIRSDQVSRYFTGAGAA